VIDRDSILKRDMEIIEQKQLEKDEREHSERFKKRQILYTWSKEYESKAKQSN
jgi:hypothetical protein